MHVVANRSTKRKDSGARPKDGRTAPGKGGCEGVEILKPLEILVAEVGIIVCLIRQCIPHKTGDVCETIENVGALLFFTILLVH